MNSRGLRHHHGSRLSRAQRVATYAAFAAAWLSGTFWLLFHYFLQQQGEFALEPHPLEHWWLRLHGLASRGLVLCRRVDIVRFIAVRVPPRGTFAREWSKTDRSS